MHTGVKHEDSFIALGPDCNDAQAELGLRYPYMPEDHFSHGTAHIVNAYR